MTLLTVTALAVLLLRDLLAITMLFGIFSLLSASLFVAMDAVDVAFTEAAVGAGVSTILALSTLAQTNSKEKTHPRQPIIGLVVVVITGSALVYGTLDMPAYGDRKSPAQRHVAPRYIQRSPQEVGVSNMVTSVLASYRGYDTLGEVTVIFTAGIGVLILLGGSRGSKEKR